MIRNIANAAAAALVMLGAVALPVSLHSADETNPVVTRGCTIRFDTLSSTGNSVVPRIYENSAHACVGVDSVYADWSDPGKGDLVIKWSGSDPLISMSVTEDETFAERDIHCGGTGGISTTRIRCYDSSGDFVPAYSLDLYSPYANLWVTWHHMGGE